MKTLMPISAIKPTIKHIINSYSALFFMNGWLLGLCVLCITFLNPYPAFAGILCVIAAYLSACFLGFSQQFNASGAYVYNALMIGMGASLFLPSVNFVFIGFIGLAGILSFVTTLSLAHVLDYYFKLPVLSLPFVLVSLTIYAGVHTYTALSFPTLESMHSSITPAYLPLWLEGFFKALGAIVYTPTWITGGLIALLLLIHSRILFFLALVGYLAGSLIMGVLTGSIHSAFEDIIGFNYILIAMALGAGFNLPTLKSYTIALAGIACAVLVIAALQHRMPILTLPFTCITMMFMYVLHLVGYPYRPSIFKNTPEKTLEHYLVASERYSKTRATLSLPYYGTWHVWQGFNGDWTHQGAAQYAYDFVIKDINGHTYNTETSQGKLLADYYCYQQAVLSPVRGRVIHVVNYLEDHPIGSVNTTDHYGNFVLIHDIRGYFVKIAHFTQYGIDVIEGSWVEVGTPLGRCGNSGYSPQPHIHIHIQTAAYGEVQTIPFSFLNYIEYKGTAQQYYEHGQPAAQLAIGQAPPLPYYTQLTTFILDAQYTFDFIDENQSAPASQVTFVVGMAADHTLYLYNKANPNAKLYIVKPI